MGSSVEAPNWSEIPAPKDDGAARHLSGMAVPSISLTATGGSIVNLATIQGRTIVYAYPRTGKPGVENPEGWDMIPGARGCSPQSCAFRDFFGELKRLGAQAVFGLSTQDSVYQREAAERLQLPFQLLSDEQLKFASALKLPTFQTNGMVLLKRLTMIINGGRIEQVFYPVFPPDRNAGDIVKWLRDHP
jgi:peroxiredoxin